MTPFARKTQNNSHFGSLPVQVAAHQTTAENQTQAEHHVPYSERLPNPFEFSNSGGDERRASARTLVPSGPYKRLRAQGDADDAQPARSPSSTTEGGHQETPAVVPQPPGLAPREFKPDMDALYAAICRPELT